MLHHRRPGSSRSWKRQLLSAWAGAATLLLAVKAADATPSQWTIASGGNGHWYELIVVTAGINWENAQAAAVASGGYLATLTTNGENSFAFALADAAPAAWDVYGGAFGEVGGPWLGGVQPAGSPEPDGNWTWINGEGLFTTAGYNVNWISASPNNLGGNENRIQFYGLGLQRSALWNDRNDAALLRGYVVEWNTNPIPEPATWAMMVCGLGAFAYAKRRHTPNAGRAEA